VVIFTLLFSSVVIFNPTEVQAATYVWDDENELMIVDDFTIGTSDVVKAKGRIMIMEGATLNVYGRLYCTRADPPDQPAGIDLMGGYLIVDGRGTRNGRVEIDTSGTGELAGISIQGGEATMYSARINRTGESSNYFSISLGMDSSFKTVGDSVNSNSIEGINGFEISGDGYTLENVTIRDFNEIGIAIDGLMLNEGTLTIKHVRLVDSGEEDQAGFSLFQFPLVPGAVNYSFENISIDSDIGLNVSQGLEPLVLKNISITDYDLGVICSGGADVILLNSNITSDHSTDDVVLNGDSQLRLFDSWLQDNDEYFLTFGEEVVPYSTQLQFGTLINVGVRNQYGEIVPGANISVESTFQAGPGPAPLQQTFPFFPFHPAYFSITTDEYGELLGVPVILDDTHLDQDEIEEEQTYFPHRVYATLLDAQNYTEKDGTDRITTDTDWVNVTLEQYPDMYIDTENITLSKARPAAGVNIPPLYVNGTVFNDGNYTTTCNVTFSYSAVGDMVNLNRIGNQTISVLAKENATASVVWNTTLDMVGNHTIHVNITEAKGEFNLTYNNASKEVTLYTPRPDVTITEIFSSLPMIVDGDLPSIGFNLSNVGEASVGDVNVTVSYIREGRNVTWNDTGNYLENVTNLTTINLGTYLHSFYDWRNESKAYYTMQNVSWDTTDFANDSEEVNLSEPLWNYTLYFVVEYNNTINSTMLSGENLTHVIFNNTFSIYKYYEASAEIDNNISFINPEKPETSFPISVLNSGRAFDNITVSASLWASNETNSANWHYSLYTKSGDEWVNFTEEMDGFDLKGGNFSTLYANVSGTKQGNEIIGEPGEFVYVNLSFVSTGNMSRLFNITLLVVNGRGDLTVDRIRFFREDGTEAKRKDKDRHDQKSLLVNETSTIRVYVQNLGNATVYLPFQVGVKDTTMDVWLGNVTHTGQIERFDVSWVDIPYNFTDYNFSNMVHNFSVYIDAPDVINESDETNNEGADKIYVKDENPTDDYTFKGNAFSWDGITKVEDAKVTITNDRTGGSYTNQTDGNGYFTIVVPKADYMERDRFTMDVEVENVGSEHYPLKDSYETPAVYSEDNSTRHDFTLLADGVDLAIYKRYEHNISLYRKDGKRTNFPIVDDEITIEFFIANRGRNSTTGTYSIMVDGTLREQVEDKSFPTSRRLTRITFSYTFTEIATDHNISVTIVSLDDLYQWNNFSLRENIEVKGNETNADYLISASIYENDAVTPAQYADVVIKNIRTNQSISFQADKNGKFEGKNLNTMTGGYREGDEIWVFAKTQGGSGNLTFYAYSEDGGKNITLIFAKFDVSLVIGDNEKNVAPGKTARYTLEITNLGNREDTIELEMESEMGRNWGTLSTNKVVVKPGEKDKVYLDVTIPGGTRAGIMENITVRATTNYGNDGPEDVKTAYTTVSQVYLLDVDIVGTVEQTGLPEETLRYTMQITNRGNGEDFVILGVVDSFGWDIQFSENTVLLEKQDDFKDITVYVTIPENEPYQSRVELTTRARSSGGIYFYSSETLNASVGLLLDGTLERITPDQNAEPDEVVQYQVEVTNTGNRDNEGFTIRARRDIDKSSVQGTVQFSSGSTTTVTLDSGETRTITVLVTPNPNAAAGGVLVATVEITSPSIVHPQKLSITTTIDQKMEDPTLTRDDPERKSILPGKSVTFKFTVTNNVNNVDTISFQIENSNPTDFEVSMNGVTVPGSDNRAVTLTVRAELMSAHFGSEAYINVTALSSLSGALKSEKIPTHVSVDESIYGFSLEAPNPIIVVTLGDSNIYSFNITRNSALIDEYSAVYLVTLSYVGIDWDFVYLDTIMFPVGKDKKTVSMSVTISENTKTPDTNKTVTIRVKSLENPELSEDIDLKIFLNMKPVIQEPIIEDEKDVRIYLEKDPVYYNTDYTFTANLGFDGDEIENEVKEYSWDWGDLSPPGEGSVATHNYARPDAYTITLRVKEWSDLEHTELYSESFDQFLFDAQNPGPIFDMEVVGGNESYPKGASIEFKIIEVEERELTAVSYTWNLGDGTIKTSTVKTEEDLVITYAYVRSGEYTVNVRGEDRFGKSFSRERTITITNQKPIAAFKMVVGDREETTKQVIKEGDEVAFDARASTDPDAGDIIISYVWDFGDGTNGTGLTPTHIYKKKDTWTVTLTVYDQEGEESVISAQVVVEQKTEETPFYIWLLLGILAVMIAFLVIMLFVPGAMARITGTSKIDIVAVIKKKIDERIDSMEDEEILDKVRQKVPQVLVKEQIVTEPGKGVGAAAVGATVGAGVAPAPVFGSQFCTNCGATLEPGARFCTECGTSFR